MMILLTGANGVVGYPLKLKLVEQGSDIISVSRQAMTTQDSRELSLQWDLEQSMSGEVKADLQSCHALIHCAPIWLLPAHLNDLKALGFARMIVFSSTSVLSKQGSSNLQEQRLVSQLADAEQAIETFCAAHAMSLTILRPSMIYGYGRDQNVMQLANFIKKFGFMMLVGKADGKRQPVHADDLVEVCSKILDNPSTYGKAYNLAGGEVLTYRYMVERIFSAMNKKPLIFSLPLSLFRFFLKLAARLTSFAYTPEMADRMNKDLSYDTRDAKQDFDYQPQLFLQHPEQDLKLNRAVGEE